MATVGIKQASVAIKTDDLQLITGSAGVGTNGVYIVDVKTDLGTKQANITGLTGNTQTVYGNNTVTDMTFGDSAPKVAITINNLNLDVKMKLLGFKSDGKGGYIKANNQRSALLLEAPAVHNKGMIYYGFPAGYFSETSVNMQTNTETEQRAEDELTFSAIASDVLGGEKFKIYYSEAPGFDADKMRQEVFGTTASTTSVSS